MANRTESDLGAASARITIDRETSPATAHVVIRTNRGREIHRMLTAAQSGLTGPQLITLAGLLDTIYASAIALEGFA